MEAKTQLLSVLMPSKEKRPVDLRDRKKRRVIRWYTVFSTRSMRRSMDVHGSVRCCVDSRHYCVDFQVPWRCEEMFSGPPVNVMWLRSSAMFGLRQCSK